MLKLKDAKTNRARLLRIERVHNTEPIEHMKAAANGRSKGMGRELIHIWEIDMDRAA